MMGKTHVVVGTASAIAIVAPNSIEGCLLALMGGALGGIISDIDTKSNKYCRDALYARFFAVSIIIISLIIDFEISGIISNYFRNSDTTYILIGVGVFTCLCFIGTFTSHRTFTHSLLAMVLFASVIAFICMPILLPFIAGFTSHLLLDILNKQRIKLFFPIGKGFCFKICYANKIADKIFFILGTLGTILFLGDSILGIG